MNTGSYIAKKIETGATTPAEINIMHAGIDQYVLTQVARGRISLEEANQMAVGTNVMSDGGVFYHEEPTDDGGRTFWFENNSLTWADSWRKADKIKIRISFDKDGNLRSISDRTLSLGREYQYEDYLCENAYTTKNGIQTIQSTISTVEYSDNSGPSSNKFEVRKCALESYIFQKTEGSNGLPGRIQSDVNEYDAFELEAVAYAILTKHRDGLYSESDKHYYNIVLSQIDHLLQSPVFDGKDFLHSVEPADTAKAIKQSIKSQVYNILEDLRIECMRSGVELPKDLKDATEQLRNKCRSAMTLSMTLKDRTSDAVQRTKEKSGQDQKLEQNKDIRNAQEPQK